MAYLIDDFVTVAPGQPYRLFPFGVIVKGGKRREITRELAARFKLPHFKPPIKLGSHEETTPAGGHIVGLEVRDDGLYAVPEINETGSDALERGSYRYHSPEVIWEGSGYEDPRTGDIIEGPLIVGDALLHTPHLGEQAALYSVEQITDKEDKMDNVSIPTPLWEKFLAVLHIGGSDKPEEPPAPEPVIPDEYAAAMQERDQLKAEIEHQKAEQAHRARVEQFAAQLKETKVEQGAEMLAGMTDDQAEWALQQFRALSAQVNESALFEEVGSDAPAEEQPLNDVINQYAADHKVGYVEAFNAVLAEHPELFV